jgi:glutathione S-transferase
MNAKLTLFYSPQTRATGVLTLLEELGAPYELEVMSLKAGENRRPEYLAVNPLGKVPAIRHGEAVVTEQVAIYIYLADAFPAAGLAPAIGDPLRGPYLRWLAFYGSAFEPAVVDLARKLDAGPHAMSPYGSFEEVLGFVQAQLSAGPYLFGERFTAADILWGSALRWTTGFGLVPASPEIAAYIENVCGRPSFAKVAKLDEDLQARLDARVG